MLLQLVLERAKESHFHMNACRRLIAQSGRKLNNRDHVQLVANGDPVCSGKRGGLKEEE